jgi:multidrug resistance efflux pump
VVEVTHRVGDVVSRGEVLVRFDTGRLDNEIGKKKRAIRAGEKELAQLEESYRLLGEQHATARKKAEADLAQGVEEVRQQKQRRACDVGEAGAEYRQALYEADQQRRLWSVRATQKLELVKAETRARQTREKLTRALMPVDESRLAVLRQALTLTDQDYAVRKEELRIKQVVRGKELTAEQSDLTNLELERREAVLLAPVAGVVTVGDVKVGDVVERGKVVMEIAEQGGLRFEAEVPNEDVGDLRPGMPARVKLDAFDYQKYGALEGIVQFVAPDSGTRDGAAGQPQRPSYVVRIELRGDEVGRGDWRGWARLGMTGQAEIVLARESVLSVFVRKLRRSISLD